MIIRQDRYLRTDIETISTVKVYNQEVFIYQCFLLELPWRNNRQGTSCIPKGMYIIKKRKSGENGSRIKYPHLEVMNVPTREGIKWHVANYVKQLMGCGAPGKLAEDIDRDGIVDMVSSRLALNELLNVLDDENILIITDEQV